MLRIQDPPEKEKAEVVSKELDELAREGARRMLAQALEAEVKFTPGKAGGLSSVSPSKGPKLAPPKGGCLANPAPCSTNRG